MAPHHLVVFSSPLALDPSLATAIHSILSMLSIPFWLELQILSSELILKNSPRSQILLFERIQFTGTVPVKLPVSHLSIGLLCNYLYLAWEILFLFSSFSSELSCCHCSCLTWTWPIKAVACKIECLRNHPGILLKCKFRLCISRVGLKIPYLLNKLPSDGIATTAPPSPDEKQNTKTPDSWICIILSLLYTHIGPLALWPELASR